MDDSTAIADLLRHSAWMRRLALGLARDDAAADDLVQESWLSALQHPPSAERKARPWLGEVLRNARRMMLRGNARRALREGGEADTLPVPTADELVGKSEVARLLAEELLMLEAPHREVLLLRYYEGLSSSEIGSRLHLASGTVRWRLAEGLERLRSRLDRREGSRETWLGALTPILPSRKLLAKGALAMKIGAAALLATGAAGVLFAVAQTTEARPTFLPTAAARASDPTSAEPLASAPSISHAAHAKLLGQITAALTTGRAKAGAGAGESVPLPALDKEYIQAQMKDVILPLVKECYERALRMQPTLAGKLVVRYSIVGDPSVGGLVGESHIVDDKSTLADADLRECVQESMYAARFPPPSVGGHVEVEYPFTLSAEAPLEPKTNP